MVWCVHCTVHTLADWERDSLRHGAVNVRPSWAQTVLLTGSRDWYDAHTHSLTDLAPMQATESFLHWVLHAGQTHWSSAANRRLNMAGGYYPLDHMVRTKKLRAPCLLRRTELKMSAYSRTHAPVSIAWMVSYIVCELSVIYVHSIPP